MSVAFARSLFGEDHGRHDLAAMVGPVEPTGDDDVDQLLASANVGQLFWYTLPTLKITMETLRAAYKKAGIDQRWLPGEIRPADAFRRATSSLERSTEVPMDGKPMRATLMVRDVVGSDKDRVVRQAVVEVRDAAKVRLLYTPAGQFELRKQDTRADAWEMDGIETLPTSAQEMVREAVRGFASVYEDALQYLDDGHVRRAMDAMMREEHVVSVRPSGGVFFALEKRREVVRQLGDLFDGLRDAEIAGTFYAVPVINMAKQREMVAEAALVHVKGEVGSLIHEVDKILTDQAEGRRVRQSTAEGYLRELKRLSDLVGEYRAATRDHLADATGELDLLKTQVTTLLAVAE